MQGLYSLLVSFLQLNTRPKQLNEGSIYFGPQFWGTVLRGRKGTMEGTGES